MVKKVLRSAEKFSEPFPLSPLPLYYPSPSVQHHYTQEALICELLRELHVQLQGPSKTCITVTICMVF